VSKTLERPSNLDHKHYAFQSLKQKETQTLQNQTLKAKETLMKGKNRKRGDFAGEITSLYGLTMRPLFL